MATARKNSRASPDAAALPPAPVVTPPRWTPRPYQALVFEAYARGIRRFQLPWHRRAGKDITGINFARERMDAEPGAYWHLFPKLVQAKRAIWLGVNPDTGRRFVDEIFPTRTYAHEQEMFLRLPNESTWQLGGSDSYDRLVGANVRGVVFSEWSLCDPLAWEFIRPILVENHGWAMFIYTFRGKNHAWQQWRKLQGNPDWHLDLRTIEQTTRHDGTPVVTAEAVERERRDGMSEAMIRQEFYCDPIAARPGALYGEAMARILGHRARCVYDPAAPVTAVWNLEHAPANICVLFAQEFGNEVNVIGSRTWAFTSLPNCLRELSEFPWESKRHVIRPGIADADIWPGFFTAQGLTAEEHASSLSVGHAFAVTEAMLERTTIDTAPRPWLDSVESGNNELLCDSLNGYRLRPQPESESQFTDTPLVSHERYFVGAMETMACWARSRGKGRARGGLDYSEQDRAVI